MNFFIEEAQHHEWMQNILRMEICTGSGMERKGRKENMVKGQKSKLNVTCDNCGQDGHLKGLTVTQRWCWKEGQGPWQKKSKKKTNEMQL